MPIAAAIPYVVAAASVASSVYAAKQTSKAANKAVDAQKAALGDQKALLESLRYAPIDVEKLKREASAQAVQNATQSLALERSLQPELANTRQELAKQVNSDLSLRGNLPPDVANRVASEARTVGGRSGTQDNVGPLTASLIGNTSLDLIRQRQGAAAGLLAMNPLQPTGLDPGALASLEVAQNAAQNQFNLEKAGVSSNLINASVGVANAEAKARGAEIGGQVGIINSLTGLLGGSPATLYDMLKPKANALASSSTPNFNYQAPKFNYSLLGSSPVT